MNRQQLRQEAQMQKILWNRLKQWLRMSMALSSLLVAGIYAAFQTAFPGVAAVRVLLFVLLAADCIWMLAAGKIDRKSKIALGPFLCAGLILKILCGCSG